MFVCVPRLRPFRLPTPKRLTSFCHPHGVAFGKEHERRGRSFKSTIHWFNLTSRCSDSTPSSDFPLVASLPFIYVAVVLLLLLLCLLYFIIIFLLLFFLFLFFFFTRSIRSSCVFMCGSIGVRSWSHSTWAPTSTHLSFLLLLLL